MYTDTRVLRTVYYIFPMSSELFSELRSTKRPSFVVLSEWESSSTQKDSQKSPAIDSTCGSSDMTAV